MPYKFEEDIIEICFEILNKSLYFLKNPSKDHSQRGNVVYVCRVVSAMVRATASPARGQPGHLQDAVETSLSALCRSTAMTTVVCFRGTGERTTPRALALWNGTAVWPSCGSGRPGVGSQ